MALPHTIECIGVDDYLSGESDGALRHEYVDGQVYAMAGGSERHNRIALNIAFHLRAAARGRPCGTFIADMKVRVRAVNLFYYPDVMLTCEPGDDHPLYKEHPCLIAEVLSPSTATTDRREKWFAFRRLESLRYYLLVDAEQVAVDYYLRDGAGEWQVARLDPGEMLNVECDNYRAALSLEDIYEDVGLALPP